MTAISDWQNLKPVARKLYAEMSATHGEHIHAFVEALEIARRQAEVDATAKDWRTRHGFDLERARGNFGSKEYQAGGNLVTAAAGVFKSLCSEFGPQRACHILTGIDREHTRIKWAANLKAWRHLHGMTPEQAATELGLSVEDVYDIEAATINAGPAAMRLIRPALRRVREEIEGGKLS